MPYKNDFTLRVQPWVSIDTLRWRARTRTRTRARTQGCSQAAPHETRTPGRVHLVTLRLDCVLRPAITSVSERESVCERQGKSVGERETVWLLLLQQMTWMDMCLLAAGSPRVRPEVHRRQITVPSHMSTSRDLPFHTQH